MDENEKIAIYVPGSVDYLGRTRMSVLYHLTKKELKTKKLTSVIMPGLLLNGSIAGFQGFIPGGAYASANMEIVHFYQY